MYPVTPRSKSVITVRETYPITPELDKLGLSGKPHGNGNCVDIAPMNGFRNETFYVVAPVYGIITESGYGNERGNYICIKDNQTEHWFYHLYKSYTKIGQKVVKGMPLGIMGNSGKSTAKHVHYEVRNGLPIRSYLS